MAEKREVARIADESLWDSFVVSSPQGSVFSTSAYLRASAEAQGGEPVILGVFEAGRIIAGTAFLEIRRGPFLKATTPVLAPYGGFVFAPFSGTRPSEEESRNTGSAGDLIEFLRTRYHHVFLIQDPCVADVREFLWRGFSCPARYTYTCDIADPERLDSGMERRVRAVIRHAEESLALGDGLTAGEFGELYARTYGDRNNGAPVPRVLVERLVGKLLASGCAEMRSVRDGNGELIAAMVFAFDRRTVYALVSGTIPSRNPAGASSLLFRDAMNRHAGKRGRFDLVGANMRSIAFFKKGFGGALTPYFVTERYSSPLVRAAFSAYAGIHKAFS